MQYFLGLTFLDHSTYHLRSNISSPRHHATGAGIAGGRAGHVNRMNLTGGKLLRKIIVVVRVHYCTMTTLPVRFTAFTVA